VQSLLRVLILLWVTASSPAAEPGTDLRLAMSGGFQPFSTTDASGALVGFDADIAKELSRRMGRKPVLIQVDWSGIQAGLQTGKYDLICASMAITPERSQNLAFSLPYYVSGAQVFGDRPLGEKARVGVTESSTYANYLAAQVPDANVLRFGSEAEIVTALQADKLDAFVSDRIVGGFYLKTAGLTQVTARGPLLYSEACAIAARKDQSELVQQVNLGLLAMVQDGTYSRIYQQWVGVEPDLPELLLSWSKHPPQIKAATSGSPAPPPGFASAPSDTLWLLGKGALLTIQLSLLTGAMSLATGTALAVVLCLGPAPLRATARAYILLIRGTPLLVQLFVAYFGVATAINQAMGAEVMGAFQAALLALLVNTTAYHAETLRGAIAAVDSGQWDAAASLGMGRLATMRRIILPQALRDSLPSLGNNTIVLIKDTSLVGAITLVELTYSARNLVFQSGQAFLPFMLAGLYYLVIIGACAGLVNFCEGWLSGPRKEAR